MPVDYFVELRGLEKGSYRAVASGYVTVSAALRRCIYAVAINGSGYAANPRTLFAKVSRAQDAGLHLAKRRTP
jgi:hypothetical protein